MHGWSLVLTREVNGWLCRLDDEAFGRVAYHLDLLCERGVYLGQPRSRPLRRGRPNVPPVRQLTIPDGRRSHRLTYCLDADGTIVALTVRRWWRPARWELHRALDAIARHHGHDRRVRARDARGVRRRGWRGWAGGWRRPGAGGCGTGRSGSGRERA